MMIEVGETEEGLNVLGFVWFQPILDNLDFIGGRVHHGYSEHCSILVMVVTVTVMVSNFSTPCIPCTLTHK